MKDIESLRATLMHGIKLSMQTSYARRVPDREAVPYLERARRDVRQFLEIDQKNGEAWRLLSKAEECLLNYSQAIQCLQKAMALDPTRRRQDLKRLALLKHSANEWDTLPLTPGQLRDLGEYLRQAGVQDCAPIKSLRLTEKWLEENHIQPQPVVEALARRGADSDFQVFYNVVRG